MWTKDIFLYFYRYDFYSVLGPDRIILSSIFHMSVLTFLVVSLVFNVQVPLQPHISTLKWLLIFYYHRSYHYGRHLYYTEYPYVFADTAVLVATSGRKINKDMNFTLKQSLALYSWSSCLEKVQEAVWGWNARKNALRKAWNLGRSQITKNTRKKLEKRTRCIAHWGNLVFGNIHFLIYETQLNHKFSMPLWAP